MKVLPPNNFRAVKPTNSLGQLKLAVDRNADRAIILFKRCDFLKHGVSKPRSPLEEKQGLLPLRARK